MLKNTCVVSASVCVPCAWRQVQRRVITVCPVAKTISPAGGDSTGLLSAGANISCGKAARSSSASCSRPSECTPVGSRWHSDTMLPMFTSGLIDGISHGCTTRRIIASVDLRCSDGLAPKRRQASRQGPIRGWSATLPATLSSTCCSATRHNGKCGAVAPVLQPVEHEHATHIAGMGVEYLRSSPVTQFTHACCPSFGSGWIQSAPACHQSGQAQQASDARCRHAQPHRPSPSSWHPGCRPGNSSTASRRAIRCRMPRYKKAPQTQGLRGFQGSVLDYIKHITGGNGGIRTLDEALHPILP